MKRLLFLLLLALLSPAAHGQAVIIAQSMADLRTINGSKAMLAILLGGNSANDGSGDLFYWNETSAAADNSLNVIQATSVVTGRWLRLRSMNVKNGSYTTSGIALTTSYVVSHNLGVVPSYVGYTPTSQNASVLSYEDKSARTATTFTIVFTTIPVVGTNNISFDWVVRL